MAWSAETKYAYGGALLGILVALVLPILLPWTSDWASTAGIIVGLCIILGPDFLKTEGEQETERKDPDSMHPKVD
uniref:Uncharacterized protein n=1 Tax=Tetraselmis sp. GSL018 TaxID=582737 RepID=A0A061QLX7_9CHLO